MRYGIAVVMAGLLSLVAVQRGPHNAVFAASFPLTFGKQAPPGTARPVEPPLPESEAEPVSEQRQGEAPIPEEEAATRPEDVAAKLEELQKEVEALRQTVDMRLGGLISDLQAENDRLREELRRVYSAQARQGGPLGPDLPEPYPPSPGEGFYGAEGGIPAEDREAMEAALDADAAALADVLQEGPPMEVTYTVLSEWGRTPEEAAELRQDTPSLKGMVCVVPEGCCERDLVAFGRKMRSDSDGYDNINIEVFDDEGAARLFVEKNVAPAGHRVMSISKYSRSGRDAIVLFQGGKALEILWTAEVPDAAQSGTSQGR